MHFSTLFIIRVLLDVLMKSARDRAYVTTFPFNFSVQDLFERIYFALKSCGCMFTYSLLVHGNSRFFYNRFSCAVNA
jgi:hypothetical protein